MGIFPQGWRLPVGTRLHARPKDQDDLGHGRAMTGSMAGRRGRGGRIPLPSPATRGSADVGVSRTGGGQCLDSLMRRSAGPRGGLGFLGEDAGRGLPCWCHRARGRWTTRHRHRAPQGREQRGVELGRRRFTWTVHPWETSLVTVAVMVRPAPRAPTWGRGSASPTAS